MTLSTSEYSRYDIDERLTIDDHLVQGPLESKKDISSVCTSQSSASESTSSSTLPTQRSIFSAYWKTDSRLSRSPPSSISSSNSEVEEETQQQQDQQHHFNCPRRRRRIFNNKTYTYTYDGDPYQFFGIEEEEDETSTTEDDSDSDSLNSYERILQKNEVSETKNHHRIGNRRRRSRTCASLSFERVGMPRTMVDSVAKTTQSDTVLFANTSSSLQRLSCLRKSRFASDADSSESKNSNHESDIDTDSSVRSSVSFEARIQVRLFIPPVENWAPSGWSNWFGGRQ